MTPPVRLRPKKPGPDLIARFSGLDLRTSALLFSTAGAVPLPILAAIDPSLVTPGGLPWMFVIWSYSLVSAVVVWVCRPVSDRQFLVLSTGGIAGIASAAFLVTDPVDAYIILCLQAAIPAMAAMHSRMRTVGVFQLIALANLAGYSFFAEPVTAGTLLRLGAGAMTIVVPTWMVLGLRASLLKSLAAQRLMSYTDPLTGLLNRRGLVVSADHLLTTARAERRGIGLLLVDIDNFKRINDRHGHGYGDTVLVQTAGVLAANATPHGLAARLGGEEFVILMGVDDVDVMTAVAEKIRHAVAATSTVTVSIGAVHATDLVVPVDADVDPNSPPAEPDPQLAAIIDDLLRSADRNLYGAKRAGRNRVHVSSGTAAA